MADRVFKLREANKILQEMVYATNQTPPEFNHNVRVVTREGKTELIRIKARNIGEAVRKAKALSTVERVIGAE